MFNISMVLFLFAIVCRSGVGEEGGGASDRKWATHHKTVKMFMIYIGYIAELGNFTVST